MDEVGFTEWAAAAQRPLLRGAYLLTGDPRDAEDLVQEAMVKVALRWDRLAPENPTAYARTVIARDHISRWRRRRRVSEVALSAGDGAAAVSSDPELAMVVRGALARLTPKQRAVVVLRHFEDLSVEEVAKALRIGTGTVKSQNAAALARLRDGAPELLDLIGRTR